MASKTNPVNMISQYMIHLPAFPKGFHLITNNILEEIGGLPDTGLMHIFLQHTSAGLTLNENADPSARFDLESAFDRVAPENHPAYTHTFEGADDMPAHIKSTLTGVSLTIPISNHRLNLGTWQGVYLCEFRRNGGRRQVVVTVYA
jgi:secondary thiamine-phosphate synthase enzyme